MLPIKFTQPLLEALFKSPVLEESLSSLQKRHQSLTDFIQQHEQEGDLASSITHSTVREFLLGFLFSFFVTMAVAVLFVTVCVHSYSRAVSLGYTSFITLYPRFA
jgi:hypothetical protein